jgi:hypothetical protein
MKKPIALLTAALSLFSLALGVRPAMAQPRGDFDPQRFQQEMQQRMSEYFRSQLVVTNDAEWGVIEGRLNKVVRSRMETMFSGGGMGMFGAMRRGGGGGEGGQRAAGMMRGLGMEPSPEAEALQKAIDAEAPTEQIKAALQKFREARKRKQAELAKAQDDLRDVLTLRQEATLVSMGILD